MAAAEAAGQSGADDNDAVLALIGGIYQLHFEAGPVPRGLYRTGRNSRVQFHIQRISPAGLTPARMASGTMMKSKHEDERKRLHCHLKSRGVARVRESE